MPAVTQAVILARGLGTRMRQSPDSGRATDSAGAGRRVLDAAQTAAADAGLKGMIPVGRPFLEYVLSALADAGITDVVLVIAPEHAAVREHFAVTAPPARVRVRFRVQAEPRGTADALLAAADAVGDEPFLMLNSDNYYPAAQCAALAALGVSGLVAFDAEALVQEGGIERDRVLRYALVDFDAHGWLRAIREKPTDDDPLVRRADRWVSMNLWSFTSRIFEACRLVQESPRGELELQSAVTIAMHELGERFRVITARVGVLDLSSRSDIATVAARLRHVQARP